MCKRTRDGGRESNRYHFGSRPVVLFAFPCFLVLASATHVPAAPPSPMVAGPIRCLASCGALGRRRRLAACRLWHGGAALLGRPQACAHWKRGWASSTVLTRPTLTAALQFSSQEGSQCRDRVLLLMPGWLAGYEPSTLARHCVDGFRFEHVCGWRRALCVGRFLPSGNVAACGMHKGCHGGVGLEWQRHEILSYDLHSLCRPSESITAVDR